MKYAQWLVSLVVLIGVCALTLMLTGFTLRTFWEAAIVGWTYGGLL